MQEEHKRGLLSPRPLALYHERTRRRGVNSFVYWPLRAVIKPAILLYFRLRRLGREHIPSGGVILAANHRSFLDPFAIGCCNPRPIYFVAKQELFRNPLLGWILNCMGAFPVRRGESDNESVKTSLALLERGQAVVIFPEGTRIPAGSLAKPKRGVGRLALQSGAPVVPIAISGSEHARDGWKIKPVRVHVRFGPALTYPRVESPSPFLAGEVTERIWPCVGLQWEWLGGLPPLRTAAVVGGGSMGTAIASVLARAGLDVQLGCRTTSQAARLLDDRENAAYLPGVALEARIEPKTVREIEFGGVDLVVLRRAVQQPARRDRRDRRPRGRAQRGAGRLQGARSAARHHAHGLRGRARARASGRQPGRPGARARGDRGRRRGGGGHAQPGPAPPAARGARRGRPDRGDDRRRDRRRAGRLREERRGARVGRRRAAGRQPRRRRRPAGSSPRCTRWRWRAAVAARRSPAWPARATWSRPRSPRAAATAAPASWSAPACPSVQVEAAVQQTAESLATVPLLSEAFAREGIDAPITTGLRRVLDGEASPEQWLESVRSANPKRRTRAA